MGSPSRTSRHRRRAVILGSVPDRPGGRHNREVRGRCQVLHPWWLDQAGGRAICRRPV